jgi:DNA helicase-2/ATP-dependent DNA helicase PcrA
MPPTLPLLSAPVLSVRHRFAPADDASPASPLAVDLHLHSPYAGGSSKEMTLENILYWARLKGLDVLGTGDCLHADRLAEIETVLEETESGLLVPRAGHDERCLEKLPVRLHRPLHFVLSTEVCCTPAGTDKFSGLHHLIYFRSLTSAHRFRERIARFGDLTDGRPALRLNSYELLALVLEHGDGCELAPAHILSPWYSALGSVGGKSSLRAVFGDLSPHLLAIEAGLSATVPMCRRISSLDAHALFCNSDAHSLDNLGREYTLIATEPGYVPLMRALREPATREVRSFVKSPAEFSGYYLNWCHACECAFDTRICPSCHRPLAIGTRDRVASIADRTGPSDSVFTAPAPELLPLADLMAHLTGGNRKSKTLHDFQNRLIHDLGSERMLLTEASFSELTSAGVVPALADAIIQQRTTPIRPHHLAPPAASPLPNPLSEQTCFAFA